MKTVMTNGPSGANAPAFMRSAEWLDIYLAQRTPELVEAAIKFATGQARRVGVVRHVDDAYVDDLVEDVLDDTLTGKLTWDPERVALKKHVFDAIQSRARHAYHHALKFKPVRLDSPGVMRAAEAALHDEREHARAVSRVTAAVLDALRELADDDHEVCLILGALSQLVTKRFDILKHTKLTAKQYDAARKRMRRLTEQLPANLRNAALGRE